MAVFRIDQEGVKTTQTKKVSEKRLQDIVEKSNRLIILGERLTFLGSQVPAGTGFIDTLALDEQNRFVVVEYKIKEDKGALLQAMDYASFIVRNPGPFLRFVKDKKGLDEEHITEEVRIIILGPEFSERTKSAAVLVSSPIKIMRYSYSQSGESNFLFVEVVYDSAEETPARTPVLHTIEGKFRDNYSPMKPLYEELERVILGLGQDIRHYPRKAYIAFKRNHVFAVIRNYTNRIDVGMLIEEDDDRLLEANWRWSSRVNKCVRLFKKEDIDDQLVEWLKGCYVNA